MRKIIIVSVFIASVVSLFAQGEADNWYFGKFAAMTFDTPDKSPRFTIGSVMNADEGCASISDRDGKLLFYTDGETIWNADNVQMPNGNGLHGHQSSTQSAVIVKQPLSENIYYIFTVDRQGNPYGLSYSIVDMNLDKGRGDVISKNNYLHYPVAEKITAIRHEEENGIWIIAHEWGSDRFLTYLLKDTGLVEIPVISRVGTQQTGDNMNAGGYMKASPDGKYVALTIYWDGIFEILHFDNSTGKLFDPITFDSDELKYLYGVEFSANSSKVYFSQSYEPSRIYQVDLKAGNKFDILNSLTVVAENFSYYSYQALQLAPDKKIYVAKRNKSYLSAIEKPNEKGAACNFVENAFDLSPAVSYAGLPTFNQSFFEIYLKISGNTDICEGDSLLLRCNEYDGAQYSWTGPDGFASDSFEIKIYPARANNAGWYKVVINLNSETNTDSVFVNVFPRPEVSILPGDTAYICNGEATVLVANPIDSNFSYFWNTGEQGESIVVREPGNYFLIISNENGCRDTAYCLVEQREQPLVEIVPDSPAELCKGESLELGTKDTYVNYLWSTGERTPTIEIDEPGLYFVNVIDKYGCSGTDTITVKLLDTDIPVYNDIDFEKVPVGYGKSVNVKLYNIGSDSIYITDISRMLHSPHFDLDFSVNLPVWLDGKDTITLTITFQPKSEGMFVDTVSIVVAAPCEISRLFQISGYTGDVYTAVWLPDTSAKIGDTDFVIPLYSKMLTDDTLQLSYTAEIEFDASIFYPYDNQDVIVSSKVEDGLRKLTLRGDDIVLTGYQDVLAEIKGTVLLSSGVYPLIIKSFKWNFPQVNTDTTNGSLKASGVCRPELAQIMMLQNVTLNIYPNPANDYIIFEFDDENLEINSVKIFDYTARLIDSRNQFEQINPQTYRMSISKLVMGNYYMIIETNLRRFFEKLIIIR